MIMTITFFEHAFRKMDIFVNEYYSSSILSCIGERGYNMLGSVTIKRWHYINSTFDWPILRYLEFSWLELIKSLTFDWPELIAHLASYWLQ